LWRNNIPPAQVNLGFGFYGRSFTLSNPSCKSPGCPFSAGGNAGSCTGTSGILSYTEIEAIIANKANNAVVTFDATAAAQIVTWGTNQWASYDDKTTFPLKVELANSQCLGG
jgi:chitinase